MNKKPILLRNHAAAILSAAVKELFPEAQILNSFGDSFGFYVDVLFKRKIDKGATEQIQEHMRHLIAQNLPFGSMKMMRTNAKEFFKDQGFKYTARMLDEMESQFIDVIKVGDYPSICPEPHLQGTGEIKAFTILSIEKIAYDSQITATRICGAAFESSRELKTFLKNYQTIDRKGHLALGISKGLFEIQESKLFWHAKGKNLFDQFYLTWRRWCKEGGYEEVISPMVCLDSKEMRSSILSSQLPLMVKSMKIAEWGRHLRLTQNSPYSTLLDYPIASTGTTTCLCPLKELKKELISSLQSIEQTIRMSPIKAQWSFCCCNRKGKKSPKWKQAEGFMKDALKESHIDFLESSEVAETGPRAVIMIEDLLGRMWSGPSVEIDLSQKEMLIHSSLFGPIERMIALMLESCGDVVPFETHKKGGK